jgi:rRNA maturation endonuclease Nob1
MSIVADMCQNCYEEFDPHVHSDGECPQCGGDLMPIFEDEKPYQDEVCE